MSNTSGHNAGQTDNRNALLAVAVAGIIQVGSTSGPFDWWDLLVGIILVSLLTTYEIPSDLNAKEMLVLASIWGMSLTILFGPVIQRVFDVERTGRELPSENYLACWAVATLGAMIFIDMKKKPGKKQSEETPSVAS